MLKMSNILAYNFFRLEGKSIKCTTKPNSEKITWPFPQLTKQIVKAFGWCASVPFPQQELLILILN